MDDEGGLTASTFALDEDEYSQNDSKSEEEEDECRVCRGPSEEGRPLFSPCRCSGSIGLTHQDCLTSWLAVTRGEGCCELCKVKFHFAPQYAENSPDRLAAPEVLLGLARRAVGRWLPYLIRLSFCISLWLVVAPLLTSYVYLIWMNRSISCIFERWNWQLLRADTVSGVVLAAIILISFLSLMSFADFLRVEWQQQQQQQHQPDPLEHDAGRRVRRELVDAAEDIRRRQHEVDNTLLLRFNEERAQREAQLNAAAGGWDRDNLEILLDRQRVDEAQCDIPRNAGASGDNNDTHNGNINRNNIDFRNHNNQNDDNVNDNNIHNNQVRGGPNLDVVPPPREPRMPRQAQRNNPRPGGQFDANMNIDPPLQDDRADMEINVALDELLGLRGPFSSLLRNLLWLLVFNTVYLGFFAFLPRTIGSAVFSNMMNTSVLAKLIGSLSAVRTGSEGLLSLKAAVTQIDRDSEKLNTVFRLPDFAAINLGYLSCAFLCCAVRFGWLLILTCRTNNRNTDHERNVAPAAGQAVNPAFVGGINERERRVNDQQAHPRLADGREHIGFVWGEGITLFLDATVAIVKVGILLFLKMFLLPVLLGIWLDGSSMALFGSSAEESIGYAGKDLFSFILLHWVAGITFMLLVTVSVLQLREVTHASLLAHLIRPQEPQPDLLGNLMHDSLVTQTKRMLLSLGIYTALLHLHVSVPVKIMMASGTNELLPFLKLKFWHLAMPQLQVPLELLVFHLSMLALLEKYKNSIGEMQHHWLVFMCTRFGLANFILPHEVEKFSLFGRIPVFNGDFVVNPVLVDLVSEASDVAWEGLILTSVDKVDEALLVDGCTFGETRDNGERVLKSSEAYISVPRPRSPLIDKDGNGDGGMLLTTKKGRFRLKRREDPTLEPAIEVWEEVPGKPIPRPPEGWDDLGAGGADIQGRWAWGKEKQSVIEKGVAHRSHFFGPNGHHGTKLASLLARVGLLLFFSWCATTMLIVIIVSTPLGIGRLLYVVFRVPEAYIHYPFGFAVGGAIAFPTLGLASSCFTSSANAPLLQCFGQWIGAFRTPPARKATVLLATLVCWVLVCPLTLGIIYELCLIKAPTWFLGEEDLVKPTALGWSWLTGTVLLNTWACLCSLSVFTRHFWVNVGNGLLEVEGANRGDHQDNAVAAQEDHKSGRDWQGNDGRISKFFASLKGAFLHWEWETVDHVVLLVECAVPVSKNLVTLLLAPSLVYIIWFWLMDMAMVLDEIAGVHHLYVFRLASASTLLIQLCIAFHKHIQRWFGAVHKTARDDRYLIGEILLNYQPDLDA